MRLFLRDLPNHGCNVPGRDICLLSLPKRVLGGINKLVHQGNRGQGVKGHLNHVWADEQINEKKNSPEDQLMHSEFITFGRSVNWKRLEAVRKGRSRSACPPQLEVLMWP